MLTELYQAYAKFTLRLSLAFSYIGRLTARHLSSGHQQTAAFSRKRHVHMALSSAVQQVCQYRRTQDLAAGRPSRWASAHILVILYDG